MSDLNLFLPKKAQSHRQDKVSSEIRFLVSQMFIRSDWKPVQSKDTNEYLKLQGLVSIMHVNVSPDLRRATILISNSHPEYEKENLEFLKNQRGFVRKHIAQNLKLRFTPEVDFKVDKAYENMERLLSKIDQISSQKNED